MMRLRSLVHGAAEFLDDHLDRVVPFTESPGRTPAQMMRDLPEIPPLRDSRQEPIVVVRSSCTCDATYWRNRCAELEEENDRLANALGRSGTGLALTARVTS